MTASTKKAFTLVELIVVITILAILATIAFVSFNGYTGNARDSVRLTNLDDLTKGLELSLAKGGTLPKPANSITLTAGSTTIGYQGYADSTVLSVINMSETKDPLDNTYYTYSTNANQDKYQVLGYLENADSLVFSPPYQGGAGGGIITSVYAEPASYINRTIVTEGGSIGILLSSGTLLPAQATKLDINTASTSTGYISYFDTKDYTSTLTGNLLFSNIYNRRKDLLLDKSLAKNDSALVGYWDMETMSGAQLYDISGNNNNASLTSVEVVNGKLGKGMNYFASGSKIEIPTNSSLNPSSYTLSAWLYMPSYSSNTNIGASVITNYCGSFRGTVFSVLNTGGLHDRPHNYSNSTSGNLTSTQTIPLSKWTFVSVTLENTMHKLYINGALVSNNTFSNYTPGSGCPVRIGASWTSGYGTYYGIIDEPRIYNRALSDSEITALYNATK